MGNFQRMNFPEKEPLASENIFEFKKEARKMSGKTVLVADDDQAILNLFYQVLNREGHRVLKATNGLQAVEDVRGNPVDIAILDIRMPVMDGIEVLKAIKQIDPTIEVLLVTGYADIENFKQAITSQGAFDYILKPFKIAEVLHAVRNALLKRDSLLQEKSGNQELERRLLQTEEGFTERTRQLRESQIQYRQIIENSNDMIMVVQEERLQFVNPKTTELTGYSADELQKISPHQIVHPEDRPKVEEIDARILRGENGSPTYAFRALRKNGESFWVETNTIRTRWEEKPATIKFIRDISERKKAEEALRQAYEELKDIQGKLIQSEKLAALGRFSAGITHEIKNPLSIIIGGIDFLAKKWSAGDEEARVALKKIKDAALRADHILMGLLKFSRPSKLSIERINPVELIKDTLSLLQYRMSLQNIQVYTEFEAEELIVNVDKSQIQQVLLNLLLNAVEAMSGKGKLSVQTYKEVRSSLLAGKTACVIEITDTGEGISREDLAKLFEPFFTTKRDSKGTGLGLSISKMIIDNHQGNLMITSEKGEGTKVRLSLPLEKGGYS